MLARGGLEAAVADLEQRSRVPTDLAGYVRQRR